MKNDNNVAVECTLCNIAYKGEFKVCDLCHYASDSQCALCLDFHEATFNCQE